MKLTFDPAKRQACLEQRGLDFAEAAEVFAGFNVDIEDTRFPYPELRIISFGQLRRRLVVIVWTQEGEARRIISMRKANDRERARLAPYFEP